MKRIMIQVALMLAVPAMPAHASHQGDRYGDERERCSDSDDCGGQDYDQWNNDQRNHNRRNRGAFSPGPFDRSPVDAFNNLCAPGATCHYDGQRGRDGEPQ